MATPPLPQGEEEEGDCKYYPDPGAYPDLALPSLPAARALGERERRRAARFCFSAWSRVLNLPCRERAAFAESVLAGLEGDRPTRRGLVRMVTVALYAGMQPSPVAETIFAQQGRAHREAGVPLETLAGLGEALLVTWRGVFGPEQAAALRGPLGLAIAWMVLRMVEGAATPRDATLLLAAKRTREQARKIAGAE